MPWERYPVESFQNDEGTVERRTIATQGRLDQIDGNLLGARYSIEAIPTRWLKDLDPATWDACEQQARALLPTSEPVPSRL